MSKKNTGPYSAWFGYKFQAAMFFETLIKQPSLKGIYEFSEDFILFGNNEYSAFQVKTTSSIENETQAFYSLNAATLYKYIKEIPNHYFWKAFNPSSFNKNFYFATNCPIKFQRKQHFKKFLVDIDELAFKVSNKNLKNSLEILRENNYKLNLSPKSINFNYEETINQLSNIESIQKIKNLFDDEISLKEAINCVLNSIWDKVQRNKNPNFYVEHINDGFNRITENYLSLHKKIVYKSNFKFKNLKKFSSNLNKLKQILEGQSEISDDFLSQTNFIAYCKSNKKHINWFVIEEISTLLDLKINNELVDFKKYNKYLCILNEIEKIKDEYYQNKYNDQIFFYLEKISKGQNEYISIISTEELIALNLWRM